MSTNPVRKSGPLADADALARQAHANVMQAARNEFASVMRQLNQAPRPAATGRPKTPSLPQAKPAGTHETPND
ncbi:MAG: hypothetical protein EPO32_12635 [Anaerolineae bacterium]|nr:MAG: hypothetical protein EPO32_12635 [Anaerolineae bacterium]